MTRAACVEQLAEAIAAIRVDHPTRVAVDGVDGVGKTTLADELVAPLARSGRQVLRASIDGFHRPRSFRYQRGKDSPEGYFLDSFDYVALRVELLDPLGPGGSRRIRTAVFDYRTDQPLDVPQQTTEVNAILLFDGVFLQRTELTDAWDFRVWLDAPFEVTVPRAVTRDANGSDQIEAIQAQYQRRYAPGQMLYLNQCRPKEAATVIVDAVDPGRPNLQFVRS